MINPPIYRLTTAVSDIDQTNINRDIRDGNWLSIVNICHGLLGPQNGSDLPSALGLVLNVSAAPHAQSEQGKASKKWYFLTPSLKRM